MNCRQLVCLGLCCLALPAWQLLFATTTLAADPGIAALRAVDRQGKGNEAAQAAWKQVAALPAERLPEILSAMDEASPLATNWLRAAVDAIGERTARTEGKLPQQALEAFVLDRHHSAKARRLAYEWLVVADSTAPKRLLPGMLDDPSLELRRDAVARLIDQVNKLPVEKEEPKIVAVGRQALSAARDSDQIKELTEKLRSVGETVDLPLQYGFIQYWQVIGPFDNTNKQGFSAIYPPENKLDLAASYEGKHGPVKWVKCDTADEMGKVDLSKILVKERGVTAYAYNDFVVEEEQPIEIRISSVNATKVWLNGQLIGAFEVYHAGEDMDQYVAKGTLKAGSNQILIKVCQNEPTEDWAQDWVFALRVCDATGGAVIAANRPPSPSPAKPANQQASLGK